MKIFFGLFALLYSSFAITDTLEHYMNIANNIPKMLMKADPQAQAWARSAKNVLIITSESIAETMVQANQVAPTPFFCLPDNKKLTAQLLNKLIQENYSKASSNDNNLKQQTVSQFAWSVVMNHYPCNTSKKNQVAIRHVSRLFTE